MAENTSQQDFSKFHTMPVEEWESTGGRPYIKYLEKAQARREVDKLSSEEKNDLARLNAFKQGKDGPEEENYEYDEGVIDWTRINEPTKVVFYLAWPRFMLSKTNQNIQGYVKSKFKTKSELGIAKEARKKLEAMSPKEEKDSEKKEDSVINQETEEHENKEEGKKVSLWVRFGRYCKDANEKDALHRLAILNSRDLEDEEQEKKSPQKLQEQGIKNADAQVKESSEDEKEILDT